MIDWKSEAIARQAGNREGVNALQKTQQSQAAFIGVNTTTSGLDLKGPVIAELPATQGVNGPDDYIGIVGDDAMLAVLDAARTMGDGDHAASHRELCGHMMSKSQAITLLLELAEDIEFFHTPDRDPFASISVTGHLESFLVGGEEFSHFLLHRYYGSTSSVPPKQALEDVVRLFSARALFEGAEQAVFLRVAEYEGKIYLDLGDASWNVVEISGTGWKVGANPPVRFVRSRGVRPLPNPVPGGDVSHLRSFLNITDREWPLVLAFILAAFRPRGPFPILILNGEQGSCKSSASAVIRSLVDPNAAPLRTSPRDERDLFIAANNSWIITLDNLSHLPEWLSDGLCRLSTGGGFTTRKLFTDLAETIINAQRPIVLNGISELATRGDLLDRSIVVCLPTLPAASRRDEAEFWSSFESAKPKLLGALLDVLVAALAELPNTKLACKPRMADFALFGVAVERALGWPRDTFIKAYEENRGAANSSAIEASPVALAVQHLVDEGQTFEGTATDLLDRLSQYADEQTKQNRGWPDSGWKLSGALRRLAPNLRASGVEVTVGERLPDRKRTRIIRVRSAASAASDVSIITEDQSNKQSHVVASNGPSTGGSPPFSLAGSQRTCATDASDAPDAPEQASMVRGEI
jgi:hypothetical protein